MISKKFFRILLISIVMVIPCHALSIRASSLMQLVSALRCVSIGYLAGVAHEHISHKRVCMGDAANKQKISYEQQKTSRDVHLTIENGFCDLSKTCEKYTLQEAQEEKPVQSEVRVQEGILGKQRFPRWFKRR